MLSWSASSQARAVAFLIAMSSDVGQVAPDTTPNHSPAVQRDRPHQNLQSGSPQR
jgi:hypothetical protein